MSVIEIDGGNKLNGEVNIQGSKNAVLPILAATVLVNGITKLNHCPKILDVFHMIKILEAIGCHVIWEDSTIIVDSTMLHTSTIPDELVKKMRSSIILMGAMLGRNGSVVITYPGGCTIGARPIDFHLNSFKKMGISVVEKHGLIYCTTDGIKGTDIVLKFPSVGATENIILAAVFAEGKTKIYNAAREPEINELCNFLNTSGANITGIGTENIEINGVKTLHDVNYTVASDRIVAGTYLAAVAGTGGKVTLKEVDYISQISLLEVLGEMGCNISYDENNITISSTGKIHPVSVIRTMPYPGFPTDMQSQIMSVLTIASGTSRIIEDIFEGRYQNVKEQIKFGANIEIQGREAIVYGVPELKGCEVYASELRGGAALVIAGLMAEGKTILHNPFYIERGYEDICRDLRILGANIKYVD